MFTGIIEDIARVVNLEKDGGNLHLDLTCAFTNELKIDQSVAHNGVCLTVVAIHDDVYRVTAIEETLNRSNIGELKVGDEVNVERCTQLGDRLDGHIVQGHVDTVGTCSKVVEHDGSKEFFFTYNSDQITVEKGSITVNGVSLTVVHSDKNEFSVAIIPFTLEHTNFKNFKVGSKVNLEFDVIGKYVAKYLANQGM